MDNGNVITAQLSGVAVEGDLIVSTFGENFGQLIVGSASGQRQIIITNPGTNPNTVGPLAITTGGTNPTDFELDTNSSANALTLDTDFPAGAGNFTVDQTACDGKTLGTNESCTLYVRLTPQAGPGEKFGTVTVDTVGLAGSYVIARTMVKLGHWQFQPDDVTIYPNVQQGTGHRIDISTYVHYAGAVPGTSNPTNAWPAGISPPPARTSRGSTGRRMPATSAPTSYRSHERRE